MSEAPDWTKCSYCKMWYEFAPPCPSCGCFQAGSIAEHSALFFSQEFSPPKFPSCLNEIGFLQDIVNRISKAIVHRGLSS
jgi:hypothetical protein